MAEHPIQDMMGTTIDKIRQMVDSSIIIGDPIKADEATTIIPVSRVTFGFAAGGSDVGASASKQMFGGGSGAGVSVTPVAFLVIRGENVRMLPVAEPASTSVDRLIELLPDLLEKGEAYFAEKKAAKEAEKAAEEA